jgi:hypothetical protein
MFQELLRNKYTLKIKAGIGQTRRISLPDSAYQSKFFRFLCLLLNSTNLTRKSNALEKDSSESQNLIGNEH